MADGYIKLYRSTFTHWLCDDKPYDEFHAWVDLLQLANFAASKSSYRGEMIERRRGEVNRSKKNLSLRWGWSYNRVCRFLAKLEDDEMISVKTNRRRTVITIRNYSRYQDSTSPISADRSSSISVEEIQREIEAKHYKYVSAQQFVEYYEDHGGIPKTWKRILPGWEKKAEEREASIPHPYGKPEVQHSKDDVQAAIEAFKRGEVHE